MAEITWVKLRTNMFDDEKIRLIERLPEGDSILVVWVKLLAHAGKSNCNGYIMISENIPMNVEEVAAIFNRPFEKVKYAISVLQRYKMIEVSEEEVISITNWEKHQNIEGMDKIRLQNRERKRLERERKKTLLLENNVSQNSHVTVTGHHATDIDIEKEKEKDIKDIAQQVAKVSEWEKDFDEFWSYYPKKVDKAKAKLKYKSKHKQDGKDIILNGLLMYMKEIAIKKTDKNYIKNPLTFLNAESYLNEFDLTETKQKSNNYQKQSGLGAVLNKYKNGVNNNENNIHASGGNVLENDRLLLQYDAE